MDPNLTSHEGSIVQQRAKGTSSPYRNLQADDEGSIIKPQLHANDHP